MAFSVGLTSASSRSLGTRPLPVVALDIGAKDRAKVRPLETSQKRGDLSMGLIIRDYVNLETLDFIG